MQLRAETFALAVDKDGSGEKKNKCEKPHSIVLQSQCQNVTLLHCNDCACFLL